MVGLRLLVGKNKLAVLARPYYNPVIVTAFSEESGM
jgi:hypothetical protein